MFYYMPKLGKEVPEAMKRLTKLFGNEVIIYKPHVCNYVLLYAPLLVVKEFLDLMEIINPRMRIFLPSEIINWMVILRRLKMRANINHLHMVCLSYEYIV